MQELGGLFGPYYGNVLPYTRRETEVSDAEVVYRLTPHSAIGVTGGYQNFNYDNLGYSSTNLIPSHNFNGSVFYSQEISRRLTVGAQYAIFDIYSYRMRAQAQDLSVQHLAHHSPAHPHVLGRSGA